MHRGSSEWLTASPGLDMPFPTCAGDPDPIDACAPGTVSQSPLAASVHSTVHRLDNMCAGPTLPLGPWETFSDLTGALRILTPVPL